MPLKDPDAKREYQRDWYRRNAERQATLASNRRESYRTRNTRIVQVAFLEAEGACPGCGSRDQMHLIVKRRQLARLAHGPCSEAKIREAVRRCAPDEGNP